jgi:hypothetical protein
MSMMPVNLLDDGTVVERTDACLGVRFFLHPELDELRSKEEGRPIYKEIEMIEILTPGSKDVLHRKVSDLDRMRFRNRYQSFVDMAKNQIEGTPLNQFHFISAGEIKELEYFNVFTAEQLINMPDGNIEKVGVNGRDLIKKVKAVMAKAKDNAFVSKITEENEYLKREMSLIKEQMNQILQMKKDAGIEDEKPKRAKRKQPVES